MTSRIVVLGGFGLFGGAAVERLREDGHSPLVGSRRPNAGVQVDVENRESIRKAFRAGDVVIDTVGPFQERTTALLLGAIDTGFHLIDISDSLEFCKKVYALHDAIGRSGVAVLTACSSISSVSAMLVAHSRLSSPVRVSAFLAPASRYAAAPGTSASLVYSVGRSITVLEEGREAAKPGWSEPCEFVLPPPLGRKTGRLFESADSFTLPLVWPSLKSVTFHVHSNVFGLDTVLALARRVAPVKWLLRRSLRWSLPIAKLLGSRSGCLLYEIQDETGEECRYAFVARQRGYFTPIVPAVLAAEALAEGRFGERALVPPHKHVVPEDVFTYLEQIGVEPFVWRSGTWEGL